MINVLLVDDHELVRLGIRTVLADTQDIKVVGEAESGEQALQLTAELRPDVVVLDVKMPGMDGVEATRRLIKQQPEVLIIALTSMHEEPFPSRMLQAGAAAYVSKMAGMDEIVQAIRQVCAGKHYVSPEIAQKLALKHLTQQDYLSPVEVLSGRELDVMLLIIHGNKIQAIAEQMGLSPKTVNTYRYRIFKKLQVNSDIELMKLAMRYELIESRDI